MYKCNFCLNRVPLEVDQLKPECVQRFGCKAGNDPNARMCDYFRDNGQVVDVTFTEVTQVKEEPKVNEENKIEEGESK